MYMYIYSHTRVYIQMMTLYDPSPDSMRRCLYISTCICKLIPIYIHMYIFT